ncbi:hypothetical protein DPMN_026813 [Dreissena polymorpha]|uniref:GTP-binding protein Rhes n=1 Tax=Dreissena polymorpha TaxID=45954 RepID=A0A9D4LSD4_DREPO|nr:hypothetical protein DPMN_026813 [Dreissena polymorpha]
MSLLDRGASAPEENCRRLVVLGSSNVGKTSIIVRFLENTFVDTHTPTIEDFHRKVYKIRGEAYRLDILDTAGIHPFPAIRRLSYATGDIFIIVYDLTSRHSFNECQDILEQLYASKQGADDVLSPVPVVLVGNKLDRENARTVSFSEVKGLCEGSNPLIDCFEVSAKFNSNLEKIFIRLFEMAKLPVEMSPSMHRKVTPSYTGNNKPRRFNIGRKVSEACGVLQMNARRPSVATDLMVAKNRGSVKRSDSKETRRCTIQ